MTLVVDCSIAASWGMPDENSAAAIQALPIAQSQGLVVPTLFWHELRNVFLVNERRGRLSAHETRTGLELVLDLSPATDALDTHDSVLSVARKYALSAYDAAYLELAVRKSATLATLDKKLARAGSSESLTVVCDW